MSARRQQVRVEFSLEAQCRGPGHDDVAILSPGDIEGASVEFDGGATLGEAPSTGSNECGAGARAAGRGDPGTPLPHTQPDCSGSAHLGDTDVGAFREERVMFEDG